MIAIARVAAVAAVTTGVAFCCPTFVAVKQELRNPRAVAVKAFGMVMVLSSLANWCVVHCTCHAPFVNVCSAAEG